MLYSYGYQKYHNLSTGPEELITFEFRVIGCKIR
jgi:hypothetical protein